MEPKDIKILLVDDEEGFRKPMEFWLKAKGYQVSGVGSGEECLAFLAKEKPCLVCLDMRMLGMNGIETLRKIRETDKQLPVIMITAHGTSNDMKEAERLGVAGFFKKGDDFSSAVKLIVIALKAEKIITNNSH